MEPGRPDEEEGALSDRIALCLSGGGYRAMLFHVGGILRLNELGLLRTLDRVSSVSGGSITAGVLAAAWSKLTWSADDVAADLGPLLVSPLRALARTTIDEHAVVAGLFRPDQTIGERVTAAYDDHLFHGLTLQDLPDAGHGPRFVINATNVQTGKLFRFSRPFAGDYTVGLWREPTIALADAVAASSAFPPILSPHTVRPSGRFDPATAGPNDDPALREEIWLSDGGVYDNLGLETAWKRYRTILVSDGGGALEVEERPKRDWARHGIRVTEIIDGQVRALRKRQLITGFRRGDRLGTYWSVRSAIDDYGLADPLPFPPADQQTAAGVETRLAALDEAVQVSLINWGYVIADTALRRWVVKGASKPSRLPVAR